MRMLRGFRFDEFDPSVERPDWHAILSRYLIMALIVVVPVVLAALQYIKIAAPWVFHFGVACAALYVPALLLIRRPSVVLDDRFQVIVKNPKTVDTRILVKAACSAGVYFTLLSFAIFILGGSLWASFARS